MTEFSYLYAVVAVLVGLYGVISVRSVRNPWLRVVGATCVLLALVVAFFAQAQMLGRAQPAEWHIFDGGARVKVLSAKIVEGHGIYLYVLYPDSGIPHSIVLPWNLKLAQELQDTVRGFGGADDANQKSVDIELDLQYRFNWDDRKGPVFHRAPQPAEPMKIPEEVME